MDELEQLLRGAIPGQLRAIALEIPENGSGIGTSPDGGRRSFDTVITA